MNTLIFNHDTAVAEAHPGAKAGRVRVAVMAAKFGPASVLRTVIWRALIAAILLIAIGNAYAQVKEEALHGADGIFVSPDAAIVWAVLKQPTGDKATVWLRVVNSTKKFTHVSIDGVDPFTKKRERVYSGGKLDSEARIPSDRDTFSDLPSREVHFYKTEVDWRAEKPALTVYYLGVPDTTPEFTARSALDQYFDSVRLVAHTVTKKP